MASGIPRSLNANQRETTSGAFDYSWCHISFKFSQPSISHPRDWESVEVAGCSTHADRKHWPLSMSHTRAELASDPLSKRFPSMDTDRHVTAFSCPMNLGAETLGECWISRGGSRRSIMYILPEAEPTKQVCSALSTVTEWRGSFSWTLNRVLPVWRSWTPVLFLSSWTQILDPRLRN
jgi:hypothetical protein